MRYFDEKFQFQEVDLTAMSAADFFTGNRFYFWFYPAFHGQEN